MDILLATNEIRIPQGLKGYKNPQRSAKRWTLTGFLR